MRSRQGATLLELVVAFALLGVIGLFLLNLLPSTAFVNRRAEHETSATNYLREVMDTATARDFGGMSDGVYDADTPGPFGPLLDNRTLPDGTVLEARVQVSPVTGIPRERLLRLRVEISWPERSGARTLVSERQLSSVLK